MKMNFSTRIIPLLILIGCIGEYNIDLPFEEPTLTVDAMLSSAQNESYVTLGWTYPVGTRCFYNPYNPSIATPCPPDTVKGGNYRITGKVTIQEAGGYQYAFPFQMHEKTSYITLLMTGVVGTPGKKYAMTIEITYNNQTTLYQAETMMYQTPEISKIDYEVRKGDIGKQDDFVPLIYFREPRDQENYYLFRLCETRQGSGTVNCGNDRVWSYSIISDEFLPEFVEGLSIDAGATVARYADFYPPANPGTGVQVKMYSITQDTYNFYQALLAQFNNDGGAYSPTPATPPGNISNGAIGNFRAIAESAAEVYY